MASTKRKAASERQLEIVQAAREILVSEGFHKLTLRSVANKVGIKLASLQYHFSSRAALIQALIGQASDYYQSRASELLEPEFGKEPKQNFEQAIRSMLDADNFTNTAIMSYAVKFASAMYGPFRQAAEGAPSSGDRKTYQMDYRSPLQIYPEAAQDVEEGADMLMVKPAWTYLDVIADVRRNFDLPLAAYHVSGEFSVLHAAAANGWIDLKDSAIEVTSAIKRAGADLIITYFAEKLAQWI